MEEAGAAVIAEAGPQAQDIVERGLGEILQAWPTGEEFLEIGADRRHRCLLQHDFGEPDGVGVGLLAVGGAPGHCAAVAVVPGKEGFGVGCR